MRGTRRLNPDEIDEVTGKDRFGVYRLANSDAGAVGHDSFRYRSAGSAESAYKRECRQYHYHMEHGHIENQRHPARPKGNNCRCPICHR